MRPAQAQPHVRWLMVVMSSSVALIALPACDGRKAAALRADPSKDVTSATLEQELSRVADEVAAPPPVVANSNQPSLKPDRDALLQELNQRTPNPLIVKAGDEAKLQDGEFDDVQNRARLKKAESLLKDFRMDVPAITKHLFVVNSKQPLTGVRLALLVQLAERQAGQTSNQSKK